MLERKYIIPLRKEFMKVQTYRRSYKASKAIKEFLMQHMKVSDVKIGKELNEYITARGRKNPPHKVEVRAIKFDEKEPYVKVNLINAKIEVEAEKKKKTIAEKLKAKVTKKPEETKKKEEKESVLEHAKLEHQKPATPEKFSAKKASPKAEMIIGETGKKQR